MMNATLLDQFLAEECTRYVRDLLKGELDAARAGTGPRRKCFEFNRFEVTFDLEGDDVLVENVLDATEAGAQRIPIAEFSAALTKHQPG